MGTWTVYKTITVTQSQAMYILCNTNIFDLIIWGHDEYDTSKIPELKITKINNPTNKITCGFRFTGVIKSMARWESGNYRTESRSINDALGGYSYNQDVLADLENTHGQIVDWVYCRSTNDNNISLTIYTDGTNYGIDSGEFNAIPVVKYEDGTIQQLSGSGSNIWVSEPQYDYVVIHDGREESATGDYGTNGTIGRFTYSDWLIQQSNFEILSDKPFAKTMTDAEEYLNDGDASHLVGGGFEDEEEPDEVESDIYFYEVYNEYYSDLALTNHILTTNQKYTITFEDYPKGTTPIHAQLINNKYMNNVQFIVKNGYGKYITSASSRIGNIEVPITTDILSTFMSIRTNYGILEDTINDRYCKTVVYTNMPIIGTDGSALPGRIPDSDDMISAENGADYDCGLSECWLLNTENVQKLASIFNTTINKNSDDAVTGVVAEWVQGLSCYSNPLDVVCDLFYMPINVDDFVTGTNRSFKLQPDFFD